MQEIRTYRGEAVRPLLSTINEWVFRYYKNYPFLYVGEAETSPPPNHVFVDESEAFVLFAEERHEKIGMLIGIPLTSPLLDVKYSPYPKIPEIKKKGYDPEKILYLPCFLVNHQQRANRNLIIRLYHHAVELAKKMGKTHSMYMTIPSDDHHPLKPIPYIPLEPWEDLNHPFKPLNITLDLMWPTLQPDGSVKKSNNTNALYIQAIQNTNESF